MSDIDKIKQLRLSTGAGFKDCNIALKESNGELDKAVEILRVKGIAKASKKMSREAKEGVVAISGNNNKTSIIEVNCETDFVAKNEDFIIFVKELSDLNNDCSSDVQKLNKSNMKNGKSVEDNLIALISKIGEKITIGRLKTISNEHSINFYYQHSTIKDNVSKLGVIVSIETKETSEKIDIFGKQLSMHIAASNPIALNSNEISQQIIEKEHPDSIALSFGGQTALNCGVKLYNEGIIGKDSGIHILGTSAHIGTVQQTSTTVLVGGIGVCRLMDKGNCGAMILGTAATVIAGG